ncbi:hypothetical protein NQZ68_040291 [Dissostichus eleginoides]|nr:hypothetical protein NQZ68_040291 [Dissostichus eleginoides]
MVSRGLLLCMQCTCTSNARKPGARMEAVRAASVFLIDGQPPGPTMSSEVQRPDDSPSTSGGSSDIEQRESVPPEQERQQEQPKKKETKISSKTAAKLSTSAKRIQKELAEITLDPPPNCSKSHQEMRRSSSQVLTSNSLLADGIILMSVMAAY